MMNRGIVLVSAAFFLWGILPIYWKSLEYISSFELVSYRTVFSFLFLGLLISGKKQWKQLILKIKNSKNKIIIFTPAFLIGVNWIIYIWAINNGYLIESSLGYFIAPIIMVSLGVILLKEKLRKFQWLAVMIAATGVFIMTAIYGQFPIIAISLAATWSLYGLIRKKSPLDAIEGLLIDTVVISIPSLIYIFYTVPDLYNSVSFNLTTILLLVGTGVVSAMPLIMFVKGSKTVNFSLIGILQYICPTLIFTLGTLVYGEPLDESKIIGFIFIWTALLIYSIEGGLVMRKKLQPAGVQ